MSKSLPSEPLNWTPAMPDRRDGQDRRTVNGRSINVADILNMESPLASERRGNDRRKLRLTITGRAISVDH